MYNLNDKHTMTVAIVWTASTSSVSYRESTNLKYTGSTIHPTYNKFVRALVDGINAELRQA